MKLLLSVGLCWIFSISAEGFQCLYCTDSTCSSLESVTCSTETMCITASTSVSSEFSLFRGCASSSLCPSTGSKTFSLDLDNSGRLTSAECCDTDNCNSQTLQSPTPQSPNGRQCFFCSDDDLCVDILDCDGVEDMCIQGNAKSGTPIRGCVSANVCQAAANDGELPFYEDLGELTSGTTCCGSDLCNDGFDCLNCTDSTCSSLETVTCPTETMCITASIVEITKGSLPEFSLIRGCASPSLCPSTGSKTFSVDLIVSTNLISAECCDTENCNSQTLLSPSFQSSNSLRCLFCVSGLCDLITTCRGEEDRCIEGFDTMGNVIRGCATSSMCRAASIDGELPFTEDLRALTTTCCDSDLCNNGLQCLRCTNSMCSEFESDSCSRDTMCITASILDITPGSPSKLSLFRDCASSSLCPSTGSKLFSLDLGSSTRLISAECCDTDDCNSQTLPSPTPQSSARLRCFFCANGQCDVSLDCPGEDDGQNRCIEGTDMMGNPIRGCASVSMCDAASIDGKLPFFEDLGALRTRTTCCDSDLCNDGLQCLSCTDSTCSTAESVTCPTETMCITATILDTSPGGSTELSYFKGCGSPSLCPSTGPKTFSVDLGLSSRLISAECCETDDCNSQNLPRPTPPVSANGLSCHFCPDDRCDVFLDCQGEENVCIQGNAKSDTPVRGCVSASLCQVASTKGELPFYEGLGELTDGTTCCDSDLCNDGIECLSCTDSTCSSVESVTCPIETMCITATILETTPGSSSVPSVSRGCGSPSLCPSTGPKTFSLDLGSSSRLISAECCDTDNCNSQTLPRPTTQSTNGLSCFFCDENNRCNVIVDCQGEEDMCLQGSDVSGAEIRGCASESMCRATLRDGKLTFFEDLGELTNQPTCCTTDLCNGETIV